MGWGGAYGDGGGAYGDDARPWGGASGMEAGPCPVPRPGPPFTEPSCRAQLFLILFLSASLVSHLLSTLFPAQDRWGGGIINK